MPVPLARKRSRKVKLAPLATPAPPKKKKPEYHPSAFYKTVVSKTPTKMPKAVTKTKAYKTVSKTRAYKTASKGYGLAVSTRNKVLAKADKANWNYRRALKTFLRLQMWGAIMYLTWVLPIVDAVRWHNTYKRSEEYVRRSHEYAHARQRAQENPHSPDNWWNFFGVDRNCPDEQVKSKYRKAAFACHPDITHDNGELMKKLNNMYDQFKRERGIR